MSGYTPLFRSLTTGTLCGKWPDVGMWPIVLSLADRHGVVDVTPAYLANVTGLAVKDVAACMARFCEADPYSRSTSEKGARLVLIDPAARSWGWRIVNHGKYREAARKAAFDADRTASGADAARKREERAVSRDAKPRPDTSRDLPLSDSDKTRHRGEPRNRGSRLPEDFQPDLSYAAELLPDIDASSEFQRFRDHYRAASGAKGVKLDWQATWRNWIRNGRDRGHYARSRSTGAGNGLQCFNE